MVAKLCAGAGAGVAVGVAAAGLVFISAEVDPPEGELVGFAVAASAAIFGGIGYVIGVPVGVSKVDPHDRFIASLAGSLIGGGVGFMATIRQYHSWPSPFDLPARRGRYDVRAYTRRPYRGPPCLRWLGAQSQGERLRCRHASILSRRPAPYAAAAQVLRLPPFYNYLVSLPARRPSSYRAKAG